MSEKQDKAKKLVPIPEELLEKLKDAANKEGKNFSRYIAEALWEAVKIYEMGHSLKEVVHFYEILQAQRASGATFTPHGVLNYLTSKVYSAERERLQAVWYESGRWYGKYLAEKFEDPVQALVELLRETRWDINEVSLKRTGEMVRITCISTTLTEGGTVSLMKFVEGAINSMGYKTEKNDHVKGMVSIQFRRENYVAKTSQADGGILQ